MFASQIYGEGTISPEYHDGLAYVWCKTGAVEAVQSKRHVSWLSKNHGNHFYISFANGSFARIEPGDNLWEVLKKVTSQYDVYVFVLTLNGGYIAWTGEPGSHDNFDCVIIQNKGQPQPKKIAS